MFDQKCSFFTWGLIVIGWVVVHYLSVIRDRHKDSRDMKDRLIKQIIDLEKEAIGFHQAAQHDSQKAMEILSTIQRVSSALNRAPISLLKLDPIYIKSLRRSITLSNFDPGKFKPQSTDSKIFSNISVSASNVIEAIETKFSARYLTAWWQIFRN